MFKSKGKRIEEQINQNGHALMFEMFIALAIALKVTPKRLATLVADEDRLAKFAKEFTKHYMEARMKSVKTKLEKEIDKA